MKKRLSHFISVGFLLILLCQFTNLAGCSPSNDSDTTSGNDSGGNDNPAGSGGSGGTNCIPSAEICDGKDNDCNGKVDDVEVTDDTSPSVQVVSPIVDATDVDPKSSVTVTLSEDLAPHSVTNSSFMLKQYGRNILGQLILIGKTIQFSPSSALNLNAPFTATLSSTVLDLSCNSMGSDYSWSFRTREGSFSNPIQISTKEVK